MSAVWEDVCQQFQSQASHEHNSLQRGQMDLQRMRKGMWISGSLVKVFSKSVVSIDIFRYAPASPIWKFIYASIWGSSHTIADGVTITVRYGLIVSLSLFFSLTTTAHICFWIWIFFLVQACTTARSKTTWANVTPRNLITRVNLGLELKNYALFEPFISSSFSTFASFSTALSNLTGLMKFCVFFFTPI